MKYLIILIFAALTGCASTEYAQYTTSQQAIAASKAQSDTARYQALAQIASTGSDSARVAAVMALALGGGQGGAQTVLAVPQASPALQWASILVPGLTQLYGIRANANVAINASNNAVQTSAATTAGFVSIAGQIQAPGAVTTNTLAGTGTLGGGAYSTADRHDVTSPAPVVVTPVVQVVPTVIEPVVQVVPVVQAGGN